MRALRTSRALRTGSSQDDDVLAAHGRLVLVRVGRCPVAGRVSRVPTHARSLLRLGQAVEVQCSTWRVVRHDDAVRTTRYAGDELGDGVRHTRLDCRRIVRRWKCLRQHTGDKRSDDGQRLDDAGGTVTQRVRRLEGERSGCRGWSALRAHACKALGGEGDDRWPGHVNSIACRF